MPRSLLPPRGVFIPTSTLYDRDLPPAVRDTWAQLRGLAWGQKETPPLSIPQLVDLLDKSPSTIYGHMTILKARGALRWRSVRDGTFIVSFPDEMDESQDSRNLEMPSLLTTSINIDSNSIEDKERGIFQKSGKLENQKIREKVKKPRDPLLDNQAVMVYKGVLHLTANEQQRVDISAKVTNLEIWEDTLKHWKSHQWNPRNIPGLLDLYGKGGAEACEYCRGSRKNGHAPKQPKGRTGAIARARAEKEQNDGER